ncbi:hypothetical protein [Candidatus Similichlamydia laticola]|uniref:Uncharacterized protein n=1 Tax=Candidatus Similichlamydia laticola TaxID=2170265 RepID=A0A369KCQ1_9BACT|nr:hypothetical protein [Candidatus Similichlamydia laticola]RDB31372.1 hypothetical protein HAT2_00523 [Candidatus Similichlamydia laticola]
MISSVRFSSLRFPLSCLSRIEALFTVAGLRVAHLIEKWDGWGISAFLGSFSLVPTRFQILWRISGEVCVSTFGETNHPLEGQELAERAYASWVRYCSLGALLLLFVISCLNLSLSSLSVPAVVFLTLVSLAEFLFETLRTALMSSLIRNWANRLSEGFQNDQIPVFLKSCFRITPCSTWLAWLQSQAIFFIQLSCFVLAFYCSLMAHWKVDLAFTALGIFFWAFSFFITKICFFYCQSLNAFETAMAVFKRDTGCFLPSESILVPFLEQIDTERRILEDYWAWSKRKTDELLTRSKKLEEQYAQLKTNMYLAWNETSKGSTETEQVLWNLSVRRLTADMSSAVQELSQLTYNLNNIQLALRSSFYFCGEVCSSSLYIAKKAKALIEIEESIKAREFNFAEHVPRCGALFRRDSGFSPILAVTEV